MAVAGGLRSAGGRENFQGNDHIFFFWLSLSGDRDDDGELHK